MRTIVYHLLCTVILVVGLSVALPLLILKLALGAVAFVAAASIDAISIIQRKAHKDVVVPAIKYAMTWEPK